MAICKTTSLLPVSWSAFFHMVAVKGNMLRLMFMDICQTATDSSISFRRPTEFVIMHDELAELMQHHIDCHAHYYCSDSKACMVVFCQLRETKQPRILFLYPGLAGDREYP